MAFPCPFFGSRNAEWFAVSAHQHETDRDKNLYVEYGYRMSYSGSLR